MTGKRDHWSALADLLGTVPEGTKAEDAAAPRAGEVNADATHTDIPDAGARHQPDAERAEPAAPNDVGPCPAASAPPVDARIPELQAPTRARESEIVESPPATVGATPPAAVVATAATPKPRRGSHWNTLANLLGLGGLMGTSEPEPTAEPVPPSAPASIPTTPAAKPSVPRPSAGPSSPLPTPTRSVPTGSAERRDERRDEQRTVRRDEQRTVRRDERRDARRDEQRGRDRGRGGDRRPSETEPPSEIDVGSDAAPTAGIPAGQQQDHAEGGEGDRFRRGRRRRRGGRGRRDSERSDRDTAAAGHERCESDELPTRDETSLREADQQLFGREGQEDTVFDDSDLAGARYDDDEAVEGNRQGPSDVDAESAVDASTSEVSDKGDRQGRRRRRRRRGRRGRGDGAGDRSGVRSGERVVDADSTADEADALGRESPAGATDPLGESGESAGPSRGAESEAGEQRDRPGRRLRRRRGRGRTRDGGPPAAKSRDSGAIDDTELDDLDDPLDDESAGGYQESGLDDAGNDESYGDEGEGGEGGGEGGEHAGKHRKIPTWTETIGCIITANMEARARNPQPSYRGRGGHGGPRNR